MEQVKEIVHFVSAKPYLLLSDEDFKKVFFCLHGRKEVGVECSENLKNKLRSLPSEYCQPRLKDIKQYLINEGIEFTENFKGTTKI